MLRTVVTVLALATAGVAAASTLPGDDAYIQDGLTVLQRSESVVYAVDAKQAELTGSGINLWMQTDFASPQPTLHGTGSHQRSLARTQVDCLEHRYRFSQVRYYSGSGDLLASDDAASPWVEPKEGSVGESLVRQICLSYVPSLGEPSMPLAQAGRQGLAGPKL